MIQTRDEKGRFVKGHPVPDEWLQNLAKGWSNLKHERGIHHSPETEFKKGHPPYYIIKREHIASLQPGWVPPNKGKRWPEELKRKLRGRTPWNKGKHLSKETRDKISKAQRGKPKLKLRGRPSPLKGKKRDPAIGRKVSLAKMGHPVSERTRAKLREARMKQRMPMAFTKPELELIQIIKKRGLPFEYVGDGKFWLAGLNPDFIHNNGEKIAIDIFGRFFHDSQVGYPDKIPYFRTYNGRKKIFEKHGWKLIIFWEDEVDEKTVLERLGDVNA